MEQRVAERAAAGVGILAYGPRAGSATRISSWAGSLVATPGIGACGRPGYSSPSATSKSRVYQPGERLVGVPLGDLHPQSGVVLGEVRQRCGHEREQHCACLLCWIVLCEAAARL
ncbi:MAG: hypothetical protein ABIQ18_03405 [Umezawaea sp.]